ncbi:putative G3BP-like protein isoform X1 [Amborella trichopoda]|uniref:putative G3BP-like protein isoform X1 n=1 Tax=Amborella trichopoda TaxID=13333 RepID=UPI0005D439F1|nr:putative G3BP-like protein isoform X1 [Amborella trichopoda]|eukprot:XP_011627063.1 putative G3BP-like protein isoform X1 [Amborella trichopoda]
MAATFPAPVSAVQVGTYFVGQYYHVLQQQPDFVHQFYTDASTMLRIDGDKIDSAAAMMQIHRLIMSLNFTGIEIKTAHSLDSWNGGVLVMVSGSVHLKDSNSRRKFVQTFFLAPQEKGYFVLNDIFHFLEDDQILQSPAAAMLAHTNYDSQLNASTSHQEQAVSDYMLAGDIQGREYVAPPSHVEENNQIDEYSLPPEAHQVSEPSNVVEETPVIDDIANSFSEAVSIAREPSPALPVEGPVGEPTKHTYASILRVAKVTSGPSAPSATISRNVPPVSEWHHVPQPAAQPSYVATTVVPEKYNLEVSEDNSAPTEEEGDGRSVYVRNLPSTVLESEVETEFKTFGRIKPDGVVIRNRKDIGVCYAFVEFEDISGVQNALKATPILFGGRQVHVEERRPNSSNSRGRRGRGRGGYQSEASRGRGHFSSRSFGRATVQDAERDYTNRPRGSGTRGSYGNFDGSNGYHSRGGPRQERGSIGNQASRNGYSPSEAMA